MRTETGRDRIVRALDGIRWELDNPDPMRRRIWHVMDWFVGNAQESPRVFKAQGTREAMYAADRNYMLRYHQLRQGQRSSRDLGDVRALPYIRDIIDYGCAEPACKDSDILVFTNSDVSLCPEAMDELRRKMAGSDCCFSRRIEVQDSACLMHLRQLQTMPAHVGADLFAFRVGWWREHRTEMPDVFLACEGWDWIARFWMRQYEEDPEFGPVIYHEKHQSWWAKRENILDNPGQKWNRQEGERWARENGCEKALWDNHVYLFKSDGTWQQEPVNV
jgi:hypothetical protein